MVTLVRSVAERSTTHRVSLVCGGLAFFVTLSVAPAAVVIGSIAGLFLSKEQIDGALMTLSSYSPGVAGSLKPVVDGLVALAQQSSATTVTVTSLVSLLVATYAASKFAYGVRIALNTAFEEPDRYRGSVQRAAAAVATLVGLVAVVAFIVVLAIVPRLLEALGLRLPDVLRPHPVLAWGLVAVLVWAVCWLLIARTPRSQGRLPLWSVGPIGAALWILGATSLVGLYAQFSRTLGAAALVFGSAVVVLMWLYLCFLGLLLGSEWEAARLRAGRPVTADASPVVPDASPVVVARIGKTPTTSDDSSMG